MNELIVNADGTVTCVGDAGSVSGILAKRVKAATIPATHDVDGVELTPEIVPDADTLAQEVDAETLKTHAWRLPRVREDRLLQLRIMRNAKLDKMDDEIKDNLIERPGANRTVANSAVEKQTLRDLPDVMGPALDAMTNTDDMDAYLPSELI
ncbi:MAG: hypothetical protein HOE62_07775 [Alphaproteobacteria bacterium]|jgi:hypothetical protein|nr:hypothetical protein [Alphaproteobacteria bacterium]